MAAPPRPVRSHLIQAALWAPTGKEEDSCLEALVEQQDWHENTANRLPELSGAVIQNGAVGMDELGTMTDTQQ